MNRMPGGMIQSTIWQEIYILDLFGLLINVLQ